MERALSIIEQFERLAHRVARLAGSRDLAAEGEARLASRDAELDAISERFSRPASAPMTVDAGAPG